jgi:hypothetical protein
MHISTSHTILIALVLLTAGFVWKSFFPGAPYGEFALAIGGVAGINTTKRLLQKQEKYGCNGATRETSNAGVD